jgi:hypothetical protein
MSAWRELQPGPSELRRERHSKDPQAEILGPTLMISQWFTDSHVHG